VKKVFPILMAFIIFALPFGGLKTFAATQGLLRGLPLYDGNNSTNISTTNARQVWLDGDTNTSTSLGNSPYHVTFSSDKNITGVLADFTVKGTENVTFYFYDSIGTLIFTKVVTTDSVNDNVVVPVSVNNVRKIVFYDTVDTVTVAELEAYSAPVIHDEITNLLTTVNNNNVTLTYDFPSSNSGFTGSKIYRNGSLISTQNNLSGSFVDSGLSYDTSYSYKVTATYSDSFETSGVIDSVVIGSLPTDPATIPPSNVTGLMVSGLTGSGATLNWSNSADTDLASVNIYLNGLVVANVPLTSSYVLTGLTASTQYNYGVALVDNDGNVSSIVSTVFTTLEATDDIAPGQVKGVSADAGNSALYVKWSANTDSDLSGYNVYIDGVKFNTSVIKNTFLTVTDLVNDQSYNVEVSAVDLSGNEGAKSTISSGIPLASKLPLISMDYTLSDVADAVSSWFASQWLILAFAISIPLSFYIASRVKLLFLD
jgi:hypothetical protein